MKFSDIWARIVGKDLQDAQDEYDESATQLKSAKLRLEVAAGNLTNTSEDIWHNDERTKTAIHEMDDLK